MKEGTLDIFDAWLNSRLRLVHTCLPGTIESYSGHTTRKATVKLSIQFRTITGEILDVPPIGNVPVMFQGSKKFQMLFPLEKGDGVMVHFSEEGLGKWLKGSSNVPGDSLARFSLTDAIAVPGLWSFKNVPTSPDNIIEVDSNGKLVLDSGTKGAARVDDQIKSTSAEDAQWWTFVNTFFGVITGAPIPEPGSGSPSALQAALSLAIAAAGGVPSAITGKVTVGSTKVKVG